MSNTAAEIIQEQDDPNLFEVPSGYGVGTGDESREILPVEDTSIVRLERRIQNHVGKTPPTFDFTPQKAPASRREVEKIIALENPTFGTPRRLCTQAEAPETHALARDASRRLATAREEHVALDEHISLLIEKRIRLDREIGVLTNTLDAFAQVLDLEGVYEPS